MTALKQLVSKASTLLRLDSKSKPPPLDGEIIYCKNNVCVHPPSRIYSDQQHYPGYMTIKCQLDAMRGSTLILTWIPNTRLRNNPKFIQAKPVASQRTTPRRSPRHEVPYTPEVEEVVTSKEHRQCCSHENCTGCTGPSPVISDNREHKPLESRSRTASTRSATGVNYATRNSSTSVELDGDNIVITQEDVFESEEETSKERRSSQSDLAENESDRSSVTEGPDSMPASPPMSPLEKHALISSPAEALFEGNAESIAAAQNLIFPENSISMADADDDCSLSAVDQLCGVFSVDLGQMRSLRLFFSDDTGRNGQLVIASPESQYKILHFHNGGLEKLVDIFKDWNLFAREKKKKNADVPCKVFDIIRPNLDDSDMHPEEGVHSILSEEEWRLFMNELGQISDEGYLRKKLFFGGIEPSIRHQVWPFLLHYYPFSSSHEDREMIRNQKFILYQNIRAKRDTFGEAEKAEFWRKVQVIIDKDVVRTDRTHPYYKGIGNPNIEVMRNILLNYAASNPDIGYTQGMSDLLAPLLAELQDESMAYWCFDGLMRRTIFVSSPRDNDIDRQLRYLRELIRLLVPSFYDYLSRQKPDAMELLFSHRWILLCFKREFEEKDVLRIWEACWAHHQTDYFHLFFCAAIISIYGDDVLEQNLPIDEMLLHFSNLAMHMNANIVLRTARCLLHKFRLLPRIPCSLHDICSLCSPGMWDSGHIPVVECLRNHGYHTTDDCPFGGY